ncbi:response regulator [Paenibacillus thermotolerans]|uniref:response regulator n=1 Tax=Paenibacillus thermotolerans TaxID=3027807 RepID=UPI003CC61645
MPITILIVDDTHFMRKMASDYVTQYGHLVVGEAANGREAVLQYKSLRPDVVMMDLTMPEMNGVEAIKEIIDLDPEAVIIVCSASNQQDLIFEALDAGAKGYVLKPFNAEQLNEVITKDALPYLVDDERDADPDGISESDAQREVAATVMEEETEDESETEKVVIKEEAPLEEAVQKLNRPVFVTSYMCNWKEEIHGQKTTYSVVVTEDENKFVVEMNCEGLEPQKIQFSLDGFRELNAWLNKQLAV